MGDNYQIIIPGELNSNMGKDYMCHKHLGGCGCVFRAKNITILKDYEGDIYSSYLTCPSCKRKVVVYEASNPKGIHYGYVIDH